VLLRGVTFSEKMFRVHYQPPDVYESQFYVLGGRRVDPHFAAAIACRVLKA